ncbi:plasmid mobilization protein [Longimicrobium terrae]|uniref:Uncharacterized protein n=1 Tax=Longimicrobium terrae TaxID=1639882 RepID=A0A841GRM3_9BACT|nr:hypothetical protein [Longimicrobium terrae]MBB4635876.1 hypothetical protein [Longimicrobium terrae]MBB6070272.1 hypothetical protein [Longimicrobium terrae]NNC30776.1 hypothetical protein [Longimicrobium terrae]
MVQSAPPKLAGRQKVAPERRFTSRIVFRLLPAQYARLSARAESAGLTPNDYARDRALGRVRPSRAVRRLSAGCHEPLEELAQFIRFADQLLPHLEPEFDPASEMGRVIHRARRRFPDPVGTLASLRTLIEEAVG